MSFTHHYLDIQISLSSKLCQSPRDTQRDTSKQATKREKYVQWRRKEAQNVFALLSFSAGRIADLLQHGLLRSSFIPPAPQRELRELTRYRSSLVADCARIINRFQKVLEDTNLKLASVVTDVMGVSAHDILQEAAQKAPFIHGGDEWAYL